MSLITSSKPYKYEVAFSFLAEDETTAYTINDLLQDRLSTFVYSQRQKDLVGRDGMIAFREVFESDARIVVILYRERWGTTEWTRVEEEAIKDRVREEGPDFLVVVNLDKGKPKWLSRGHMRLYLERFGMKEAVAVIEKRVEEFGGVVREETVEDQFERHRRELQRKRKLVEYLKSQVAVDHALEEWSQLIERLEEMVKKLSDGALGYALGFSVHREKSFICWAEGVGLSFSLRRRYRDSLEGTKLVVEFGNADYFDQFPASEGQLYGTCEYQFSHNLSGQRVWQNVQDEDDLISTERLVQHWFRPMLERIKTAMVANNKYRFQI